MRIRFARKKRRLGELVGKWKRVAEATFFVKLFGVKGKKLFTIEKKCRIICLAYARMEWGKGMI